MKTTLGHLFDEAVRQFPERRALIYQNQTLTYAELNGYANGIAKQVFGKKQEGSISGFVGLATDRSIEAVSGMLGMLKAGVPFIVLDPHLPPARLEYLLKDSAITSVWTTPADTSLFFDLGCEVFDLTAIPTVNEFACQSLPEEVAYAIYTSGTTGTPKGVVVDQQAIAQSLRWRVTAYGLRPEDTVLQLFSFAFDGVFTSLFTPLLCGATVVQASNQEVKDPAVLLGLIDAHAVTHFLSVPAIFRAILDLCTPGRLHSLTSVTLAGDLISAELIAQSAQILGSTRIYNEYGCTETAVVATMSEPLCVGKPINIGKPLPDTEIFILDESLHPCLPETIGEICVATDRNARGYLNRPELTREKFVRHPLSPTKRVYRTGDYGQKNSDGTLSIRGRKDNQVKLRGLRIECEEIEAQMKLIPGITEVVVVGLKSGEETSQLASFYTASMEILETKIVEQLAKHLPAYMIPSVFRHLEKLPLGSNGKVNRQALQKAEYFPVSSVPLTPTEKAVCRILAKVLKVPEVNRDDHFFRLRGNSLNAAIAIYRISLELKVKLALKDLFEHPVVSDLAASIDKRDPSQIRSTSIREKQESHPASCAQKRIYFLSNFEQGGTAYNIPVFFRLGGVVDISNLRNALAKLIERHEPLRTCFYLKEGTVYQKVQPTFDVSFTERKITDEREVKPIADGFVRHFDLERDTLVRVALLDLNKDEHFLLFDFHHICMDGLSISIFIDELMAFYWGHMLLPLKIHYKDFSVWQIEQLETAEFKAHEAFWMGLYADTVPVLGLSTNFRRPEVSNFLGATVYFAVPSELSGRISQFCQNQALTPAVFFLAAFKTLLHRYSSDTDLVVGIPVTGRTRPDTQNMVGLFVNTLPLRSRPEASKSFSTYLSEVKDLLLNGLKHQDFPLEMLVDRLKIPRQANRMPLFDVMFTFKGFETNQKEYGSLKFQTYDYDINRVKCDLTLNVEEKGDDYLMSFEYASLLFSSERIKKAFAHLCTLIADVLVRPSQPLGEIALLTDQEKNEFASTRAENYLSIPSTHLLHELLIGNVERFSDSPAVITPRETFTYRELHRKSYFQMKRLSARGIRKGEAVAVVMNRGAEEVIAVHGILQAGGCYLPVDPKVPADRLNYILNNADVRFVLTQSTLSAKIGGMTDRQILCVDSKSESDPTESYRPVQTPADTAYILYTSGSTGFPKGVMISHQGAVNTVLDVNQRWSIGAGDRFIALTNLNFDLSVYDFFGSFAAGATLVLPDPAPYDPKRLSEMVFREKITIWNSVPALIDLYLTYIESRPALHSPYLRAVMLSGDWIPVNMASRIRKTAPQTEVISLGGNTEASIWSTYYRVDGKAQCWRSVPYGKALGQQSVYVLNSQMQECPEYAPGELYFAGVGLAKGYLKDQDKTDEAFRERNGERIYRTGDLAQFLSDGNLELLGRSDFQVKLNGLRIELGEIESHLDKYPSIKKSVVLLNDKKLVAFLTYNEAMDGPQGEDSEVELSQMLSSFLATKLPEYMVPEHFIFLTTFPLSGNGKIDRKHLKEYPVKAKREFFQPLKTEMEQTLAKLWAPLLGKEMPSIGRNANFFHLGGHSLLAVQLISQLKGRLNIELPLYKIFECPILENMARVTCEFAIALQGQWQPIVKLSGPVKEQSRVYCIPGMGSLSVSFYGLAKVLGTRHGIYALEPRGIYDDLPPHDSFAEAIADYAKELRHHPKGMPCVIVGHSIGGWMAFELVRQMEAEISSVTLVLLDSYFDPSARLRTVKDLSWQTSPLLQTLKAAGSDLQSRVPSDLSGYMNVFRKQAGYSYFPPGPVCVPVYMLYAKDGQNEVECAPELRQWENFVTSSIRYVPISGNHFTMLSGANLLDISKIVGSILEEKK